MKRIAALLLLLFLALSVPVSAAGQVTYRDDAHRFVFETGRDRSPTDLFTDFKDVMPGDRITQTITVKNDASHNVKVKLYLRSQGAHPDSEAFLSQLRLQVSDANGTVMFNAAANETAGLTDWVYLGTLYSGGETALELTLTVPVTVGNDYQDCIGCLDWEFKAEELPVEDTDPTPPETGEQIGWNAALTVLITAVAAAWLLRRRSA